MVMAIFQRPTVRRLPTQSQRYSLGCEKGLVEQLFPDAQAFIEDLERWWKLFCGLAVAKRIQAPPILSISKRAYGYDHREAQLKPFYSRKYKELKARLLKGQA